MLAAPWLLMLVMAQVPAPPPALVAEGISDGVRVSEDPGPSFFHDARLPMRATLFLNFSATYLAHPNLELSNGDNSARDISQLVPYEGLDFPGWVGTEREAIAIAQAVEADLAPYGVRIAYLQRPPARVPYTMMMMGGEAALLELTTNFGGFAPIDCDVSNTRHIAYAFNDESSVVEQANIVSHEWGHAWGLDHALGDDELMSYTGNTTDKLFTDECRGYCIAQCQGTGPSCDTRHEAFCDDGGSQHAHAELQHIFGDGAPDTEAPIAEFVAPAQGTSFEEGESFTVEAEVADEFGNFGWDLRMEHDGEVVYESADFSGIPQWYVTQPAAGQWRFVLTAEDHAEHVTTAELTVMVGETGGGSTGGTETDGGETSQDGGEDDSSGGVAEETAGEDEDTGADASDTEPRDPDAAGDDDDGCSCRGGGRAPSPTAWILVLLGVVARPRRRTRAA